mgnify:FL=1|tara:strand:+ start:37 stop:504 length:468 start_codon:yes stop_codon:yes gene_type:complete
MKNLKYLFIFLFVLSCGYTPIYQTDQKLNIKIDTISLLGDKNISRKIVKNLEKYRDSETNNIFDLFINSTKREDVVTKDKKGNATSYKLTLEVDINLSNNSNNKNFKRKFSKDMFFNSKNSKFELDQYRLSLEKNMISQILQEINLYLRNLENDL